jgi:hypothetical protein
VDTGWKLAVELLLVSSGKTFVVKFARCYQ